MDPEGLREQNHLLQEMLEQQKAYIEIQEKRIAEKDAAIADLKKLVDELQALKANLLDPGRAPEAVLWRGQRKNRVSKAF